MRGLKINEQFLIFFIFEDYKSYYKTQQLATAYSVQIENASHGRVLQPPLGSKIPEKKTLTLCRNRRSV